MCLKVVKTIIFLHFFVGYLNYYSQIYFFAKKFNLFNLVLI